MTYLGEITFVLDGRQQAIELWATEEEEIFGIDSRFLEVAAGEAFSPFDGQKIDLPDPHDATAKKKILEVKGG